MTASLRLMAPLGSRIGPLLLVAGFSSAATLAVCMFYIPTLGPAGQVTGPATALSTALSAAASSPVPSQSHTNAILPAEDLEPRSLQDTKYRNTWGYNGACVMKNRKNLFFHDVMRRSECESSRLILFLVANRVSMLVAILFNLSWHTIHCRRSPKHHAMNNPLREVSLGVFCVNIFCNPYLPEFIKKNRVIFSVVTLVIEGAVFRVTDGRKTLQLQKQMHKKFKVKLGQQQESEEESSLEDGYSLHEKDAHDLDEKDPYDLSDLKVLNKYQMMSLGFTSVFMLFVCQLALMAFYLYSLVKDREDWSENFSGLRWFVGMLVCNLAGDQEVAYTFNIKFWLKVLRNQKEMHGIWEREDEELRDGGKIFYFIPVSYRCEAIIRMIMEMTVNTFCQKIVYCTAPILLAVVYDPQEFIKDSLSYLFITQFDDLDHSITFLSDLKKRVKLDEHMMKITEDQADQAMYLRIRRKVTTCFFGSGYVFEDEKETEAKIADAEDKIEKIEAKIAEAEDKIEKTEENIAAMHKMFQALEKTTPRPLHYLQHPHH